MGSIQRTACIVLACGIALGVGCRRGDSIAQYDVSGNVTFAGKPVPSGVILFAPDTAKANHGPGGYAKIINGKYDTKLEGQGTVGGAQIVQITGFDGVAGEEQAQGKPLFPDYVTTIDLPKKTTTADFDVPSNNQRR